MSVHIYGNGKAVYIFEAKWRKRKTEKMNRGIEAIVYKVMRGVKERRGRESGAREKRT